MVNKNHKVPNDPLRITRIILIVVIALILLNILSFFPVLKSGFINWDDDKYVTRNHMIRDLTPLNLKRIFTTRLNYIYTPLVILSFAVEYHFFKLNPFPYHLDNLILHIINSLLVFWLIFLISGDLAASVVAAFLFSLSPLRVQSVAWITERKGLLCACFFFSSFISYVYSVKGKNAALYLLSIALFMMSLLSKPHAALLPFALLLYDYFIMGSRDRRTLITKIPYLLGFIAAGMVAWVYMYEEGVKEHYPFALYQGPFIASYLILFYMWKIVAPFDLLEFYPLTPELINHIPVIVWLSPFILTLLVLLIIRCIRILRIRAPRHYNHVLFGLLFFLLTIFPVIKLLPVNATSLAGLRQTYIPAVGLILIVGEGFSWLFQKSGAKLQRALLVLCVILVIAVYSISSFVQCGLYKESLTFWNHVLARFPTSVIAINNRGVAYFEQRSFRLARKDFDRALSINPFNIEAHVNLGIFSLLTEDYKNAKSHLDFAILGNTDNHYVYYFRGNIYQKEGDYETAILMYRKAIELDPSDMKPYVNLGNVLFEKRDFQGALKEFDTALSINRKSPDAYYNRGNVYFRMKDYDKAISDYSRAISCEAEYWDAYRNRALTYYVIKNFNAACADVKTLLDHSQSVQPQLILLLNHAINQGKKK